MKDPLDALLGRIPLDEIFALMPRERRHKLEQEAASLRVYSLGELARMKVKRRPGGK